MLWQNPPPFWQDWDIVAVVVILGLLMWCIGWGR